MQPNEEKHIAIEYKNGEIELLDPQEGERVYIVQTMRTTIFENEESEPIVEPTISLDEYAAPWELVEDEWVQTESVCTPVEQTSQPDPITSPTRGIYYCSICGMKGRNARTHDRHAVEVVE